MDTKDFLRLGVPLGEATRRVWKIPKGFHPSAAGCEERATLGGVKTNHNSEGVASERGCVCKTSRSAWQVRTLLVPHCCGWCSAHSRAPENEDATRVGVVGILKCKPKVVLAAQPW